MNTSRSSHPASSPVLLVTAFLLAPAAAVLAQFPDQPRDPLPPLPERRAAVLREFDRDANGRLNTTEREAARKAWAEKQLAQRGDRGFFRPPPELLEEFDANKDGELDPDEGRKAMETMGRRFEQMRKDYDKNTNSRLDPEEIAAAVADIDAGKLKGIPKMFVQFAAGPRGRPGRPGPGGPGRGPGPSGTDDDEPTALLSAADTNKDGRLSAAEKDAVRAAWAKQRQGQVPAPDANPATPSPAPGLRNP